MNRRPRRQSPGRTRQAARAAPASLFPALAVALMLAAATACGGGEDGADQLDRMAEEHEGDRPVAAAAADGEPAAAVEAREVTYGTADGSELTGYFAAPEGASDTLPGIVVIHEWWGLNDNIRTMTRKLAGQGYAALAVDLYGGEVAESPDRAGQLARSVEPEAARANLEQAHGWLTDRGAARTASIGWCFGGGWSLRTALHLPTELDAAVIYYGRLVTDVDALGLLADNGVAVQGHFGEEDGSIPVSEVEAFEQALGEAGVDHEIYLYEGAGHAFANPSGQRYQPEAAKQAWNRTVRFLAEELKR